MNHRVWKFGSGTVVACMGVTASLVIACSGDDNSTPAPTADAGSDSASTASHSSTSSAATSSSHASTSASSSIIADASVQDSATEDAAHDATTDTTVAADATPDAVADATADAKVDASPPPAAPALCSEWDATYGLMEADASTSGAQSDRGMDWANDVFLEFANELGADCRFANFNVGDDTAVANYGNQLNPFVEELSGRSVVLPSDGGGLGYAVIPASLATHPFSTADLTALSTILVTSIATAYYDDSGSMFTQTQLDAITAELTYYQGTVSTAFASTAYTLSSCPDGGDGG